MRQYRFVDLCVLCASVYGGGGRRLLCDNVSVGCISIITMIFALKTCLQGYMTSYQDHVSDINKQQERELQVENKWCSNWASSVNKIKQLYS